MGEFVKPGQGHVMLFMHWRFHGTHVHIFRDEEKLNVPDPFGSGVPELDFDLRTSSIVVLEGTWEFFKGEGHTDKLGELGPGQYPDIRFLPQFGWDGNPDKPNLEANDVIRSLKVKPCDPISW